MNQIDLRGVDIVQMAADDRVQLRGNPNGTLAGACPKCGGRDRFAVITNARAGVQLWRCRNCFGDKTLDAIRYLQHVRGITEWRDIFDTLRRYGYAGSRESFSALPSRPARQKPLITREGSTIPDALEAPPSDEWQNAATIHAVECWKRLRTADYAHVLAYLHTKRMLNDRTIDKFGIGFCDQVNREAGEWRGITVPLNYGGSIWSVNVRTNQAHGIPKYILRSGSRRCAPFNGDALADEIVTRVIICEGEFDCMLLDQHAPAGTAAITFGGKSIAPNYEAILLLRGKRCYCAFDADEAGDAGAAAWCAIAKRVRVPFGKDVTDYARSGGDLPKWIAALDDLDSPMFSGDLWNDEMIRACARAGMVATWRSAK